MMCILLPAMVVVLAAAGQPSSQPATPVLETIHPGLASGVLSYARLDDLPEGTLLESAAVRLTENELGPAVAAAAAELGQNPPGLGFYVLEQMATKPLLMHEARQCVANEKLDLRDRSDAAVLDAYQLHIMRSVQVSDAEVAEFYEANKEMCGGATLAEVKQELAQFVLQQKQQEALRQRIRTLGQRVDVRVSAKWAARQAALAKDNVVDRARGNGRILLVDFGADGCRPCDMMTPILQNLKDKYAGRVDVLFVHVRKDPVLAARYGVEGIPTQIFFDPSGREVFRHTGFLPQNEIEKQLKAVGVQ